MAARISTDSVNCQCCYFQLSDSAFLEVSGLPGNAVRVRMQPEFPFREKEEFIFGKYQALQPDVEETPENFIIRFPGISVRLDKAAEALSFFNETGERLLGEIPGSRFFQKKNNFRSAGIAFDSPPDEALFGLGEFQDGALNIRNLPRRLIQVNTQASLPMLYSTRGYGLLWHNYSMTEFNPGEIAIPLTKTGEGQSQEIEVTTSEGGSKDSSSLALWRGEFRTEESGEFAFALDCGQVMTRTHVLRIDGQTVFQRRNFWLPPFMGGRIRLEAGLHRVEVENESRDIPVLTYRADRNRTVFRSDLTTGIDYIVFSGSAPEVTKHFRALSGQVPMLPKYAFGYWHCRERYVSGEELLENLREFRKRGLPLDIIVQDWQWWEDGKWNSMVFDPVRFPDPAGLNAQVHALHARSMFSVWSVVTRTCEFGETIRKENGYIETTDWIDFSNPAAAALYCKHFSSRLMTTGIDSWWFDATEPENDALKDRKIHLGEGNFYRNIYPFLVNSRVGETLRQKQPERRALVLTRCAFSGQQRLGQVLWSGDIGSQWQDFRTQITAGLGTMLTGLAYWTSDAGGFFRPENQYDDLEYHKRLIRWFEFATFCPVQRIHGFKSRTEPWHFGETVEKVFRKYLELRYRLLPYIYTLAGDVATRGYTMMRPMVMDFASDREALRNETQYMFGPSILVAPVCEDTETAEVYLPEKEEWIDFWTGKRYRGGQYVSVDAPLDRIPLFLKAGSILPWGPAMQYVGEKDDAPEFRICDGKDAEFMLYEDDGTSYRYEQKEFSRIRFFWNESKRQLTIGEQEGEFTGMPRDRVFRISRFSCPECCVTVHYHGEKLAIDLPR